MEKRISDEYYTIDRLGTLFLISKIIWENRTLTTEYSKSLETRGCLSTKDLSSFKIRFNRKL